LVDLNVVADEGFDYKSVLKSPTQCADVSRSLRADYEKDVKRKKAEPIKTWEFPRGEGLE
jgi:hypothetical protein